MHRTTFAFVRRRGGSARAPGLLGSLGLFAMISAVCACGAFEGLNEGLTDAFEGDPFDPSQCDRCPEVEDPPPDDGFIDGYHVSCNATGLCVDYYVPTAGRADGIKDQCGAAGGEASDFGCAERGDHVCQHENDNETDDPRDDECSVTHTYGEMDSHDADCAATGGTVGGSCT